MSLFRHKGRRVPQLHTTALPDMIFTILFFFIMVTHLRQVTLKVHALPSLTVVMTSPVGSVKAWRMTPL